MQSALALVHSFALLTSSLLTQARVQAPYRAALICKDRLKAGVGVVSLWVNTAYLTKALIDAGPLGRSTSLDSRTKCMRSTPTMGTELQDERFLRLVKVVHLINHIRASGLELEAPDGAMLMA